MKLLSFSTLLVCALATELLIDRIQKAQKDLLSSGPSIDILNRYDKLIVDIASSADARASPEGLNEQNNQDSRDSSGTPVLSPAIIAQVHYRKALVQISLNKIQGAIADLTRTLELDPSLKPAAEKLVGLWIERGQFNDILGRWTEAEFPDAFAQIRAWESDYARASSVLSPSVKLAALDQAQLDTVAASFLRLFQISPNMVLLYEKHMDFLKGVIGSGSHAMANPATRDEFFSALVVSYSKLIKVAPQRSMAQYHEFAQYLLLTRTNVNDSWSVVKSCLRMDHDNKACAALSKLFSRLKEQLTQIEEYHQRDGLIYPVFGESVEVSEEKLQLSFSVEHLYKKLSLAVTIPKREARQLPSLVSTLYDYLKYQTEGFAKTEFSKFEPSKFPFLQTLNKIMCEGGGKHCSEIDESKKKFFPKHLSEIDELLKSNNLQQARQLLQQFGVNIQKTPQFRQRWAPIQQEEQRQQQQQQRQQQQFHEQQQRFRQQQHQQHQQNQQQQSHMDRSKDYYKILDVAKDADDKTIKKAYRAQTLKFHPDKYKGGDLSEQEMESKMQDINEAYEILSNELARKDYDNGGNGQQGHQGQQGHGGGGQFFRQGASHMNFQFRPEDFMGQFGGGGFKFQF